VDAYDNTTSTIIMRQRTVNLRDDARAPTETRAGHNPPISKTNPQITIDVPSSGDEFNEGDTIFATGTNKPGDHPVYGYMVDSSNPNAPATYPGVTKKQGSRWTIEFDSTKLPKNHDLTLRVRGVNGNGFDKKEHIRVIPKN
jgi:hypothetical protein